MMFGLTLEAFTRLHVLISLVAIASGLVALVAFARHHWLAKTMHVFLWTTLVTTVTGFLFPFTQLLPSHVIGVVALLVLAVTIPARYRYGLRGAWRWIYAGGAVASLYLLVFVLIAQVFTKIPALQASAPTLSEAPFAITQAVAFAAFAVLGLLAVRRFQPATAPSAAG